MSAHVLGVDVGLSGVRAAVVSQSGELAGAGRHGHRRARVGDGIAEHDPEDWLEGLHVASREALAAAGQVQIGAIGVAALGPAPVLTDERLQPLTPALLFALDRRAEPQRRAMTAAMTEGEAAATLDNALPKLRWWAERDPAVFDRAAWALDATGFVVAALTGEAVMDSITAADYELPGVEPPLPLPDTMEPTAVAGRLSPDAASRLGLPAGLPVAAGTYDSFADIAAIGVRSPGDAGIVLGSTTIICRAVPDAAPSDGLGVSAYPGEGVLLGGWTLSGGLVLDWCAEHLLGEPDMTTVAAAAQALEPGQVLALPYLAGERTPLWDPAARGALVGLSLDTRPEHVYRAFVDGLALTVRDHTERLDALLGRTTAWCLGGGGARNPLWLQATADAVGTPLDVVADAGEAIGPALLALRSQGVDPPRRAGAVVEPDSARAARYAELHEIQRRLWPALAEAEGSPA